VIQDIGYYPFGDSSFSDLTHYVRSGDFVVGLFRNAQNANELAFAVFEPECLYPRKRNFYQQLLFSVNCHREWSVGSIWVVDNESDAGLYSGWKSAKL